jgi:Transposase DDE domain
MTLGTTRLEAKGSRVPDLAERYRQRWQVETSLAQLKTTMRMEVLHGQTGPGVLKELTVCALVYNLVRLVMCQSAKLHHIGVERISFLDALRWLGAPSTGIPLGAVIVKAIRPHRGEPRVRKRRPKSFPLMSKPRQELRQQLVHQEVKA